MARRLFLNMKYLKSVVIIQSLIRGYLARRERRAYIKRVVIIQSLYRRKKAMRLLKDLKVEARSVGKLKETNYKLENKLIELSQIVQKKTKENAEGENGGRGGHTQRRPQTASVSMSHLGGSKGTVAINGQRLAVGLALAEREGPMDSSELF